MSNSQVSLFVSHSAKDKDLVGLIIQTVKAFYDLPDAQIRCTSLPGYQLTGGANIATTIQSEIRNAAVVLSVITPNSLRSPWALCELGAVWGLTGRLVPAIAGLEYHEVQGPLGVSHCWRLDDQDNVYAIMDQIGEQLKQITNRRKGRRIEENKYIEKIVKMSQNYTKLTPELSINELYSLHFSSDVVSDNSNIFQDFNISRKSGTNVNAVHFLWADTFTNSHIKALIYIEKEQSFLRVWFENGQRTSTQSEHVKGWSANVKIKPRGDGAFKNYKKEGLLKYRYMKFSARVPEDELTPEDLKEAAVSIRLLDRRLTYWDYSMIPKGGQPSQFLILSSWNEYKIDLISGGYGIFDADGNSTQVMKNNEGIPCPDFSIVAGITFVVGSYTAGVEEPGLGKGIIDFKDIIFEPV